VAPVAAEAAQRSDKAVEVYAVEEHRLGLKPFLRLPHGPPRGEAIRCVGPLGADGRAIRIITGSSGCYVTAFVQTRSGGRSWPRSSWIDSRHEEVSVGGPDR
jgi:hypothetical protein